MQDLPLQGAIADIFFPRLIARLHRDGFEGAVRVSLGPTTKVLYFRKGEIASAASNAESDRLANILIRDGRLGEAQLDMAKSRLPAGGSLGKTLIEMGFLTPAELLQGARSQVREILASSFSLSSGTYQVEPGPLPREVTVLGVPTRRLIFDCLVQARDRQLIIREMGSMESVYRPTEELIRDLGALKLDIEVDGIGRMLDGASSLRDISGRTSLDDFTVSKVVLALDLLGMAELVGIPAGVGVPAPSGRTIPIDSDEPQDAPEPIVAEAGADGPPDEEVGIEIEDEPFEPPAAPPPPARRAGRAAPVPAEVPGEGVVIAEDDQAVSEPPPIPDSEMPAFALPPDEEPQWQIDPKTGERVHVGPIEMTFDGKVGSGASDPRRRRLTVLAGAGALLIVGALAFVYARRGGNRPTAGGESEALPAPAAVAAAPSAPQAAATPAPADAPPSEAAPPGSTVPQAAATPAPPRREPAAQPSEPPGPPPHGSVSPFRDGSRYVAALRMLDTGDVDRAAGVFQELAAAEDPARFTLQLMIACEPDTLRTARAQSGDRGSLYFVPYTFNGRDCYRACWGSYAGKEEAAGAAAALPAAYASSGIRPVVISMKRLRPAG
jgi:hypothetical protein